MMERLVLLTLLFGLSYALAPLKKVASPVPDRYIVVLKDSANIDKDRTTISGFSGVKVNQEYRTAVKGFGIQVSSPTALDKIRQNKDVKYVQQDGMVNISASILPMTWGVDRIDQRNLPLDGQASFTGDGSGVNAYVIDTGVYPEHEYFEGRAQFAHDATDEDGGGPIDCHGHGTHCAGTVGAKYYGVARGANLHGVKVLSCGGWGYWSWVIGGIDWVANNHVKPAVASMSLGGYGSNPAVTESINNLYDLGVITSAAAGNSNDDACYYSPAGIPNAVTVGATDRNDYRAYFSNYGRCVDIFAPGVEVLSTMIGNPTATATWSGTSMACPHVTGVIALLLGNDNSLTPEDIWNKLNDDSTSGVLQNKRALSPDRLLYAGPESLPIVPSKPVNQTKKYH